MVRVRVQDRLGLGLGLGSGLALVVLSDLEVVVGGDSLLHERLGHRDQFDVRLGGDARVVPAGVITR